MTDLDPTDLDSLDESDDLAPVASDTRSQPLRYSVIKLMSQSPAHARHAMLRGGGEQTLARRLGSAAHAMLLGGAEVRISSGLASDNVKACCDAIRAGEDVRQYPGAVRRGKEWDKFAAANQGATIVLAKDYAQAKSIVDLEASGVVLVSKEQYDRAAAMTEAIKANPIASRVLFAPKTIRETRIDWTWNGRAWRSTPDAFEFRTLAELKTTRCADPEVFWRDALRMGYHVQAALYKRAIFETTGVKIRDAYLFAVESVPPFVVTPFRFSERSLEHGDMLAKRWHEQFLQCEASGEWPGYTRDVEELDVYDAEEESALEVERAMANDDGERVAVNF